MTLLEVITKASSGMQNLADHKTDYPIVLNPDPVMLKPKTDATESGCPVEKVVGWEISVTDNEVMELGRKFVKKLSRSLKNTISFNKGEFFDMLTSYLVRSAKRAGISPDFGTAAEGNACEVVKKLGFVMGSDVRGLVLEGCIALDVWDLLECLIIHGFVGRRCVSNLVSKLIEKRKSDLIVLSVKRLDLQAYDLLSILKYFLVLPSDGYNSLISVRKHWEKQAQSAVDKASGKALSGKDMSMTRDAAILIMLAYDGFSVTELCLHYILSSPNFDDVIFSACVSKLSGDEMKGLIRYLGKWIQKYSRFPQVVPCPHASSKLGLEVCDWIPTLENVVKCLSMSVDEHFSSCVLHSEFHELLSLGVVASSLAAEANLCGTLANLIEGLRFEDRGHQRDSLANAAS